MADRLIVDWRGLKDMGCPYGRTHTARLMDPKYSDDPFPRARKLSAYKRSRNVWPLAEVILWFQHHGLVRSDDDGKSS